MQCLEPGIDKAQRQWLAECRCFANDFYHHSLIYPQWTVKHTSLHSCTHSSSKQTEYYEAKLECRWEMTTIGKVLCDHGGSRLAVLIWRHASACGWFNSQLCCGLTQNSAEIVASGWGQGAVQTTEHNRRTLPIKHHYSLILRTLCTLSDHELK